MKEKYVITIDGPAGAGKSTVSRILAQKLSYIYLDTGAIYRTVALKASEAGIAADDEENLGRLCEGIRVSFVNEEGNLKIHLDDEEVSNKIRTEEISMLASKVSAVPSVRKALLPIQRKAAIKGGIVAEGRDMGTMVFPNADFKFYLDASVEERSRRRYLELAGKGNPSEIEGVTRDIIMRDRQDTERKVAPLKPSTDSIIIDSTNLGVDEVVSKLLAIIGGGKKRS
jgi:CMP/dCMP kinase